MAVVAVALACGVVIERFIGLQSVLLVFLLPILASAILWGLLPSLFACVLGVLAFNFFLIPPIYTFTIADPDNAVALFVFFIVAVVVSHLAAATRRQIVVAQARARTTAALYVFSRKLAGIVALDDLLWATAYQVSSMLKLNTIVLLPDQLGDKLTIASGYRRRTGSMLKKWLPRAAAGSKTAPPAEAPIQCAAANGCSCRYTPAAARSA